VFEERMMVSGESFIGQFAGAEGAKLEQQVWLPNAGAAPTSRGTLFGKIAL
jgi:hypothetical protein